MREPTAELSRTQRTLKWWLEFVTHCARELRHDRAGQMAAALSHYTLFSLLPMLVIMLVVLASFVSEDQQERFESMLANWLLKPIAVDSQGVPPDAGVEPNGGSPTENQANPPSDGPEEGLAPRGDDSAPSPRPEAPASTAKDVEDVEDVEEFNDARAALRENIRNILDELRGVSFRSIGIVGLLVFIWASTELLATVERSFNTVFGISRARPFYLRLPLYYTVITLGPLVIIGGQLGQQWFIDQLQSQSWSAWLAGPMTVLSPLLTVGVVLTLVFTLLPNTKVRPRAAATGGFIAAVLWVILIQAMRMYVARGAIANIYGALALLPLFLLWLWLTWLTVLFGLEVTYAMQSMRGRRFKHMRSKPAGELVLDGAWLLPMMSEIARAFREGRTVTAEHLGRVLQLPPRAIGRLLKPLEDRALIHRAGDAADDKAEAYCLAKPADQITAGELLRAAASLQPDPPSSRRDDPAWRMVGELRRRRQADADAVTLDELIDASHDSAAAVDASASVDADANGPGPSDSGPTASAPSSSP